MGVVIRLRAACFATTFLGFLYGVLSLVNQTKTDTLAGDTLAGMAVAAAGICGWGLADWWEQR